MKKKVADLVGAPLDWAVAKCEGLCEHRKRFDPSDSEYRDHVKKNGLMWRSGYRKLSQYTPSTNWSQGGPIIEKEGINVNFYDIDQPARWGASIYDVWEEKLRIHGPTPLVAAMRCYVTRKLGDAVDIPDVLCS